MINSSFASFACFGSSSPSEATRGRAKEVKEFMWPLATEVKDDTLAEQPFPVENNTRIYRLSLELARLTLQELP